MPKFDKEATLPLRGILVLLVVVGHSLGAVGLGRYSLAFPAVAVFFFISGYGLMQKRLRADGNPLCGGFRHAVVKFGADIFDCLCGLYGACFIAGRGGFFDA